MPELGTPTPYRLPAIRYEAPRTQTFEPPQIVPDLRGAASMRGAAVGMNLVAETLAKLPDLIGKGVAAGRKEAQQKAVHEIKLGALRGGKSPAEIQALQGFQFGEDDTLSYKPQDPYLAALARREAEVGLRYKEALTDKARRPVTTLYDRLGGVADSSGLPSPEGGVLTGEDDLGLPPLDPALAGAPAPVAVGAPRPALANPTDPYPPLPRTEAELASLAEYPNPALPGEPALGALAPVGVPIAKPTGRAALAATGQVTGPIADLPLPEPDAVSVAAAAAGQPAEAPAQDGWVKATNPNEPHKHYVGGKLTHILLPGANTPQKVAPERPAPGVSTETTELVKRGHTVAEIGTMTEEAKKAALAKPVKDTEEGFDFDDVPAANAYAEANGYESPNITQKGGRVHVKEFKPKDIDTKGKSKLTDSTKKELASSANLVGDLAELETTQERLYGEGKSGPIAGRIEGFKAKLGMGDAEYVTAAGQIDVGQFKIARLLNGPGVLTDKDITRAQAVAPTLNETPASFKAKMQNVRRMLRESVETWKTINASQSSPEVVGLADRVIGELGGKITDTAAARPAEGGFIVGRRYKGEDGSVKVYKGGSIGDDASWQ